MKTPIFVGRNPWCRVNYRDVGRLVSLVVQRSSMVMATVAWCIFGWKLCFGWLEKGRRYSNFVEQLNIPRLKPFPIILVPQIHRTPMTSKRKICLCVFFIFLLLFVCWLFFMLNSWHVSTMFGPFFEVSAATRPCCTP